MVDATTPNDRLRAQEITDAISGHMQAIETLESEAMQLAIKAGNNEGRYILRAAFRAIKTAHKHFDKVCRIFGLNEGGKG